MTHSVLSRAEPHLTCAAFHPLAYMLKQSDLSVSTVSVWVLKHFNFPYTSVVCHSSDVTIMVEIIMVDSINYKGIRK